MVFYLLFLFFVLFVVVVADFLPTVFIIILSAFI